MLSLQKIPIKNIRMHPVRSVILFLLTLAQTVCIFSGIQLVRGMRQELVQAEARLGADLLVYPTAAVSRIDMKTLLMQGTPVEVYKDRSILSRMNSCDGIAAVSHQIYISDRSDDGERIWIVGFEPERDFVIAPWTKGGRLQMPEGCVTVGSKVNISDSGTVKLYQKEWTATDRLQETGSVLDTAVFVSMDTLKSLIRASEEAGIRTFSSIDPDTDFSVALVRVKDRSQVKSVTDWINIYVRKVEAVRSEETLTRAASGIRGTTGTMTAGAFLAWIVLMLSLGMAQSMLMKERVRELYVWHSIGASRSLVNRVMLSEALILHGLGAAAGILLSFPLLGILGGRILPVPGLTPGSSISAALVAVAVTVITGLAFTSAAVKRATNRLNGQMLLTV